MIAMTHTWVRHKDHGGYWHCPTELLEKFPEQVEGWEPSEAPEEINPALAERIAWQREQEAAAEQAEKSKSTKAARRGTSTEESES